MGDGGDISNPPDRQERKYPRFKLRYPVHGKFYSGKVVSEFDAVSRNVSIRGLLLETASEIPRHSSLSFTMTIEGGRTIHPIRLVCGGASGAVRTWRMVCNCVGMQTSDCADRELSSHRNTLKFTGLAMNARWCAMLYKA
jgi:hypothetical protein